MTAETGTSGVHRPGPHNDLTDVDGIRVGHAQRVGDGALTGTTVVLGPAGGMVTAVDVRGGGPATRETDALVPGSLVPTIEAVVLTGGSAYGLDAVGGVVAWLAEQHRGVPVGPEPGHVVPVVPAAALFDLVRGGDFAARPDRDLGWNAATAADAGPVDQGNSGAGTGAVAGGLKGGVGSASTVLSSGVVVAALVAVNAHGSPRDPATGALRGASVGLSDEFSARVPTPDEHERAEARLAQLSSPTTRPLNTTIGVVATTADLDRAEAHRVAVAAHDGLPRALAPVHTLYDGDTLFSTATGTTPLPPDPMRRIPALAELHATAADTVTRAVVHAVLAAESVASPGGEYLCYRDLYPEATR